MAKPLTEERVRRDVDVLARAGLDLDTFLAEVDASVGRALPYDAACVVTTDPATHLLTGTYKFGDLLGRDERDREWGLLEYGEPEPDAFATLADADVPASAVSVANDGDVLASTRIRDYIGPFFGYGDELRAVFRSGGHTWGGIAFFRGTDERFDRGDVEFAASLSATLGAGLRAALLVRLAATTLAPPTAGPAIVVVDEHDQITQFSVGAQARLEELIGSDRSGGTVNFIASLVGGARRYAAGLSTRLPQVRVRARSGHWFVLHASPLLGSGPGQVVVAIEEARPPDVVPLVVAAFQLTPRERDITTLVLQGVDTKEIAATLHLSAWTVQDHLKSIFDKAEVRSRRELIARVCFDQYAPRLGGELGPGGWFAEG